MATTQQFKDYIKANASKLDKSKFSGLTPEQNKNLFNEWKSTGSIPKTYFSNTPAIHSDKQLKLILELLN
jgi:hypothetical protein